MPRGDYAGLVDRQSVVLSWTRPLFDECHDLFSPPLPSGDTLQAQGFIQDRLNISYYIESVSLKTASLLADACRSTVVLRGETSDSPTSNAAWDYGHNLGIAYQISNDIIAYNTILHQLTGMSEAINPPDSIEDIKVEALLKVLELPVYSLAAEHEPDLSALALRSFSVPGDAVSGILESLQLQCLTAQVRIKHIRMWHGLISGLRCGVGLLACRCSSLAQRNWR